MIAHETTGRIIIADDLPHVRASIRTMLTTMLGATVVGEAGTAAELVALLATTAADLILVDRDIRGLDDPAAVEGIRRLAPQSRIVLCNVFERGDGVRDCPLKADFTLSKSHAPEQWLQAMREMLAHRPPGIINLNIEKNSDGRRQVRIAHADGTSHTITPAPIAGASDE